MLTSMKQKCKTNKSSLKAVPDAIDMISSDWCENVIKKEMIISDETFIPSINVKSLENKLTGLKDGGGLSGSALVRVIPKYSGNLSGKEPTSFICKLSIGTGYSLSIGWNFLLYCSAGGAYDEYMMRQEAKFVEHVLPVMKNTLYRFPEIYYSSTNEKNDRGFVSAVILNRPAKLKSVILMQDMRGWRSSAVGLSVSKEDAIKCFRNVAILHSKFWGEKRKEIKTLFKPSKVERDLRPWSHNKLQAIMAKSYFSTNTITKNINRLLDSDWKTSLTTCLKAELLVPDWFQVRPLENGSRPVFGDEKVQEMLDVMSTRAPSYFAKKMKSFIKKPLQTILHGDFHGGNHMFGIDEHKGKIVALDFQFAGTGRVSTEFFNFFIQSLSSHSLDDIMEIAKCYHTELIVNGVIDYSWEEFVDDIQANVIGGCLYFLSMCTMMKPDFLAKMGDAMKNGEGFWKIWENCYFGKSFVLLTSIYLNDKDNFMI